MYKTGRGLAQHSRTVVGIHGFQEASECLAPHPVQKILLLRGIEFFKDLESAISVEQTPHKRGLDGVESGEFLGDVVGRSVLSPRGDVLDVAALESILEVIVLNFVH